MLFYQSSNLLEGINCVKEWHSKIRYLSEEYQYIQLYVLRIQHNFKLLHHAACNLIQNNDLKNYKSARLDDGETEEVRKFP